MSTATKAKSARNGTEPKAEATEHKTLAEAMLAAQAAMPAIEPDKGNPAFKGSKYVSLGSLIAKARPVLNRHGLVLVQMPTLAEDGKFVLATRITHAPSGQSLEFDSPLKPTKDDPQGQGSAITYMRRYALGAALAIADQEDDDGNAASEKQTAAPQATAHERKPSERPITGEQKGKVNARLAAASLTDAEASAVRVWYCAQHDCQHFDRLPNKQASNLINELREDGSGARVMLDELKIAASKDNEVAAKILARMQEAEGA